MLTKERPPSVVRRIAKHLPTRHEALPSTQ